MGVFKATRNASTAGVFKATKNKSYDSAFVSKLEDENREYASRLNDYITRRQADEWMSEDDIQGYRDALDRYRSSSKALSDFGRTFGSYNDEDEKQRTSYIDSIAADLDTSSSMFKSYKNADEYGAAVKAYDTQQRQEAWKEAYKGKTYKELSDYVRSVDYQKQRRMGDISDEEDAWLKNTYMKHDRSVVDTMTEDEVRKEKEKRSKDLKNVQDAMLKLEMEKDQGVIRPDYEQRMQALKDKEVDYSVLYFDEDDAAVTYDSLLRVKKAENTLLNVKSESTSESMYNTLLTDSDDYAKIQRLNMLATNAAGGADANSPLSPTGEEDRELFDYFSQKYGFDFSQPAYALLDKIDSLGVEIGNKYEADKIAFKGMGYDWDELDYYNKWKADKESYAERMEAVKQEAIDHPIASTIVNTLASPLQVLDYGKNIYYTAKSGGESAYGLANIYDDDLINQFKTSSSAVAQKVNEDVKNWTGSDALAWLASGAYSGVTSSVQSVALNIACVALFGPAGEAISLGIMGTQAAATAFQDAVMNGSTNGEALATSIAAGIAEAAFEKISLEKLQGIRDLVNSKSWNASTVRDLLKSILKNAGIVAVQGAVEGSEELCTDIANALADDIINGDHTAYKTDVMKYMNAGYSREEAEQMANKNWIMGVMESFYGGFIGGAVSGSVQMAANTAISAPQAIEGSIDKYRGIRSYGASIVENDNIQRLVDSAQETGSKKLRAIAEKVAGVDTSASDFTEKSRNKLVRDAGRLYYGVQEAQGKSLTKAARSDFSTKVREELSQKGVEDIDKAAEAVVRYAEGKELSGSQRRVFDTVGGESVIRTVQDSTMGEKTADAYGKKLSTDALPFISRADTELGSQKAVDLKDRVSSTGYTVIADTGENIAIDKQNAIASVKGDEVYLNTDKGTVKLSNIEFANENEARLYESFNDYNPAVASALIRNYDGSVSVRQYVNGMRQGIDVYGKYNFQGVGIDISKDSFFADLSPADQQYALKLGRSIAKSEAQAAQMAVAAKTATKTRGRVQFAEGVTAETKAQKNGVALAKHLASALGINITFFDSTKDVKHKNDNGWYDPATDSIHLDINAGDNHEGTIAYTLGHELTHFIKKWSPEKFKVFGDFLVEQYGKHGISTQEMLEAQMSKLNTTDAAVAYEEMVADACQTMLLDSNAVEKLVQLRQQDKGLFEKIKEFIHNILDKLRKEYAGIDPNSDEAKALRSMTDVVEQLSTLFEDAAVDAAQAHSQATKTSEMSEDTHTKHSTRNEEDKQSAHAAAQQEITAKFKTAVDQVLNMQNTKADNLIIGYTPKLMQTMGMPALPFVIGTGHVYSAAKTEAQAKQDGNYRKGVHYHGLGAEVVKNIYEQLQDPVMIIAAKDVNKTASPLRSTHSVVAIVDVGKAGKSLLLPVEITAERTVNGEQMDVNVLSSLYERSVEGLVQEAISLENIGETGIYYAKKEATALIPAGVQFPIRIQKAIASDPIIRSFDTKVNRKIADVTQSQQFKRWFGDWQNHPESASKVVNADGTPMVVYHQTDADFTVFNTSNQRAGKLDTDTPTGMFFKPTDQDIGISGEKQMAVYLNARSMLELKNREEAHSYWMKNIPQYAELQEQYDAVDKKYNARYENAEAESDAWYEKHYDELVSGQISDAEAMQIMDAPLDKILAEWKSKTEPIAIRQKELITAYMQQSQYDGLHLLYDGSRNGVDVETYIVFSPTQIKSATDNIGTFDGSNPDIRYSKRSSNERYTYDALVSKPDMPVTELKGTVPGNRADVLYVAKRNAAKVGKFNPKDGSVSVHVDDIDADVLLSTDGLKHGLRRTKDIRTNINAIVTLQAGEIIKNSIRINELIPSKQNASGSFVLIGTAKDGDGHLYIVRSVINQFELGSMDVLYAINAKKGESAALNAPRSTTMSLSVTDSTKRDLAALNAPRVSRPRYQSSISISTLLDFVNQYFPDILPEEVLKHYGHTARPEGDLGQSALYSTRNKSNRELLSEALETTIDTATPAGQYEAKLLGQYKENIGMLDGLQAHLKEVNAEIRALTFGDAPRDPARLRTLKEEKIKTENRIGIYDSRLLRLEATKPIKDVLEREKKRVKQETVTAFRGATKEQKAISETRGKIKRVVSSLDQLLNHGSKERNVKADMQETVGAVLSLASVIFNDDIANEDIVKMGAQTATPEEQKLLDKYTEYIRLRDNSEFDEARKYISKISDLNGRLKELFVRERERLNRTKVADAVTELSDAYARLKNSNDDFVNFAYDGEVASRIAALKEELGGTTVRDMTSDQLRSVYQVFRMVKHMVSTSNNLFRMGKAQSLSDTTKSVQGEVLTWLKQEHGDPNATTEKIAEQFRSFGWNELKPVYAFERLGSDTYMQLFWDAINAEGVWARDVEEAKTFLDAQVEKTGYRKWDMQEAHTFKLPDGRTFKLTLQDMMSIYAYSKREQAYEHMTVGGFQFAENSEYRENGRKKVHATGELYTVDADTIQAIIKALTPQQAAYVDAVQTYLTEIGKKGNEVSRALYGIDLFTEKTYFPLMSSRDYRSSVETTLNGTQTQVSLKNTGMSKPTVPHAKNPIILQGFDTVVNKHIDTMSKYHAYVLPIENLRRVFDSTTIGADGRYVSTKNIIKKVYGKSAMEYFENYITDLNGGTFMQGYHSPTIGLFAKFKATAVGASLSVIIQQPFAIIRAMNMISPQYFVFGKVGERQAESRYAEIKKYAPVAIIKEMGGFDMGNSRTAAEYLTTRTDKGLKRTVDTINNAAQWGAGKADELGWGIIWDAVKRETYKKDLKYGSKEFYEACGKRFTEVITYTQVYDSVNSRSGMMRSKHDSVKFATSFMGEPTTVINMAYSAILKVQRAKGSAAKRKAFAKLVGTAGVLFASALLNGAAKSLVYAGRDDDDDEAYFERWAKQFAGSMHPLTGDISPLTMLPYVKDIVSLFQGYDVEQPDMTLIANVTKDIARVIKKWDDMDLDTALGLIGDVGNLCGLPLKNIIRDARGVINTVGDAFDSVYPTDIGGALMRGFSGESQSNTDALYGATMRGDSGRIEVIKGKYKTDASYETAIKRALRENDPRIKIALKARLAGNNDRYQQIRQEIIDEEKFDKQTVNDAMKAEYDYYTGKIEEAAKLLKEGNKASSDDIIRELKKKYKGVFTQDDIMAAVKRKAGIQK